DEGHPAHHLADLVALEVADEVQRRPLVGPLGQLLRHLLDPVLPQGVDAGGNGRPAGRRVIHLAGPHQEDLPRVPARPLRRRGHAAPDGADIFRDLIAFHHSITFPSYRSSAAVMTWSPSRRTRVPVVPSAGVTNI